MRPTICAITAKICDFGLSHAGGYFYGTRGTDNVALPVRWMAPFARLCIDARFSEASDVWAFGVLVWEMFTLCSIPVHAAGVRL
jgi:serine/threonine protein kinase